MIRLTTAALIAGTCVVSVAAQNSKVVTAAQANGVYRYYDNEFRILALGHNKLKVQFRRA